jgi:hypothetical protein
MLQKKYDNKEENIKIIKNSLTYVLKILGASDSFITTSLDKIESECLSYSFPNDFMNADFGDDVNKSITSSTIITHFNSSVALYKVHAEFRNELEKSTIIMIYNADMEFVDYQFKEDIPSRYKYYQTLCDMEFELKRSLITQLKRLTTVFRCDESLLEKFFDQIYLTKNHDYTSVGKNNKNRKFDLSYHDKKFKIKTNIFSVDVDYFNSSKFDMTCDISFDTSTKITKITFVFQLKAVDRYKITQDIISFDQDLNLKKYEKKHYVDHNITIDVVPTYGLSNRDFFFLLNLKFCPHNEINDVLPELKTPSAYDFNSIDFNNRLNTSEMLLF